MVTGILMASYGYVTFGLFMAKATKLLAGIRIVTTALSVALSAAFIRAWGIDGAAYAACAAALVRLVWGGLASQKRYRLVYEHGKIALLILAAIVVYVLAPIPPWECYRGSNRSRQS